MVSKLPHMYSTRNTQYNVIHMYSTPLLI